MVLGASGFSTDLAAEPGKKQSLLHRRIAAANDCGVALSVEEAVTCCAGVYAVRQELRLALEVGVGVEVSTIL